MDLHNSEYSVNDLRSGKVKLEFGNKDHIEKIDREIRDKEIEKIIGEYEVEVRFSGSKLITVKAWDEEEAKELAEDEYFNYGADFDEVDIDDIDVTCIKEPEEEE